MIHGIKKFLLSFVFAGRGIMTVIASERNMRIHVSAALMVIALGAYFSIEVTEWCLVIICIGMVMAAEALNTAIEQMTGFLKPEFHRLAGRIKDVAAGAVLLAALAALIVGMLIFWKHFFAE